MLDALIPLVSLIILLFFSFQLFGDNSSYGPNQIALLCSMGVAVLIGLKNGYQWHEMEKAIVKGISLSLGAVMILLAVGSLIGTWLLSGTVPTMIYYGLQIINPAWFYAAACLVCGIVAMSIGSSWTTAATIGVAFIGIAGGFDMSPAITAGAVISGAYFGDKLSPLSETTNLAPAVAGSELFSHIRYMLWTTVPSILIALVLFLILGLSENADMAGNSERIEVLTKTLQETYHISVLNLLPLAMLLFLAYKKMPAFPAVFIGALVGAVWAVIFQQDLIAQLASDGLSGVTATATVVWTALFDGIKIASDNAEINDLLSRGGMSSMLNTIWLVISALSFGAVLEHLGMLRKIVESILSSVKSVGGLIASTVATCFGTNLVTADQYMAIVMPGRMYRQAYKDRNLDPLVLSRTLEDSGTITSPLIPWNSCGAFMIGAMALGSYEYIFYCFFNLINPFVAILYGFIGFNIKKLSTN
ncbi:transporter, NhaC family [Thalassotalea agarivorans]|uniref:Transporter, NhaC family n=2 Tax=Thalassotalea agarivorans TaxID=349064 RepID=A0A1I0BWP3_THASX|nr:transporter, NhaC family [Thalassotalea agarivorans]